MFGVRSETTCRTLFVSMGRFVLLAGTVSLALALSAPRILAVLLVVVYDRQALLQRLRILGVLQNLVHLQKVRFLTFRNPFDTDGQFLWTALLSLPLSALAALPASFAGGWLLVKKTEEHGVAVLKILPAATRLLPAAVLSTAALSALSAVLLLKQYAELV